MSAPVSAARSRPAATPSRSSTRSRSSASTRPRSSAPQPGSASAARSANSARPATPAKTASSTQASQPSKAPQSSQPSDRVTLSRPETQSSPSQGVQDLTRAMEENFAPKQIPGTTDTNWHNKLPDNLKKHAGAFTESGKKHGVDPRFLAAISMHETGNGTSKAFREKHNAMGIMGNDRTTRRFNDVASSIDSQAGSLRNNPAYAGRTTAKEIQEKYAPVGAHNDAKGLNSHWLTGVSKNLTALGADPTAQMIFRD